MNEQKQYVDPDDESIEDSDVFEEKIQRRYIHEDREPKRKCDNMRDYIMAFLCGVAIGYFGMMFYEKHQPPKKQKPIANETYGIKPSNGIVLSEKGKKMLYDGFKEISRKHDGWYDGRVWSGLCEILGEEGEKIPDANVKKVLDD